MLTQIIATAAEQAATIARQPGVPGDVAAHMRAFATGVPPVVSAAQQAVAGFVRDARAIVERQLQSPPLAGAANADALRRALDPVVAGARAAEAKVATASQSLSNARGQFTTDQQTLATERGRAVARRDAALSNRDRLAGEVQRLRDRATWTNIVGAFIWLVKIGDEIASAIQYRSSTEEALANAAGELQRAQLEFGALETAIQLFGTLGGLVSQLTGSVQNLANAMSFFTGTLTNQQQFAAITTPETATLFLTALRSSLAGLEQEAQ
jgi:hypothetical protein